LSKEEEIFPKPLKFRPTSTLMDVDLGGVTLSDTRKGSLNPGQPMVFMRFRPAWTYIDGIRDFGRFFCQATFGTPELADRACVIIQEVLENAVKYSRRTEDSELEMSIDSDGSNILFSVSSPPDEEHLRTLRQELTGLHALDPQQAYLAAFLRASNEPDAPARLGLARVRFEGEVELSLTEEPNGRIRLTAKGKL
jgi:hypothetical protein